MSTYNIILETIRVKLFNAGVKLSLPVRNIIYVCKIQFFLIIKQKENFSSIHLTIETKIQINLQNKKPL